MQIIDLSDEKYANDLNLLERLQSEVEARQNILAIMVDMGMKDNSNYQAYFEELLGYKAAFNMAKKNFFEEKIRSMVNGDYRMWSLDYNDKEIRIEV